MALDFFDRTSYAGFTERETIRMERMLISLEGEIRGDSGFVFLDLFDLGEDLSFGARIFEPHTPVPASIRLYVVFSA